MSTKARLLAVFKVAIASSACTAAPPTAPPAVVALVSTSQADSAAGLAAGLAREVGHWLANRSDVVVRLVDDPMVYSNAPFEEVDRTLAIDLVIRLDVRDSVSRPIVSYRLETSNGESRATRSNDGLAAIPRRIADAVLSSLELPTAGAAHLPAWPMPAPLAYDAFVRALGRAHASAISEADRAALFEKLVGLETYPPAVTELGSAYLDLAGRSSGTAPWYDRAEESLRRAVQLDTIYPLARQKLASYFAKRGRSEESLALLHNGLATHPRFPGYHEQLGYILRYAGLMEASMESYRRAQELDGSLENLVATQDQITKSLIYLGKYQEALASHEKMESFLARLGRSPDEKEWFYRGVIQLYAGDRDQALVAFERGQKLDSASVWTTFGRAYTGIARGDRALVAKALAALEQHVVVDGERHYRLVHFASFLGQSQRALHHLETSIRGGFFNAPYIGSDPLTAALRSDPGFARWLSEASDRHGRFKTAQAGASRSDG